MNRLVKSSLVFLFCAGLTSCSTTGNTKAKTNASINLNIGYSQGGLCSRHFVNSRLGVNNSNRLRSGFDLSLGHRNYRGYNNYRSNSRYYRMMNGRASSYYPYYNYRCRNGFIF